MAKIRGTHSSPGVYTQFTDLSYAAKTLGITTLGLVGETLKGPAFEPIMISDLNEYESYFGGKDASKFKDSQYPKYQLPYIAESYLKASDRLYVCRVLGLSGYNAGPAFILTAAGDDSSKNYPIGVLRSRGTYQKYANLGDDCNPTPSYDKLQFDCVKVTLEPYTNVNVITNCGTVIADSSTADGFDINVLDYGTFTIVCYDKNNKELARAAVTLNPGSKDYIYDIIGSNPTDGSFPVFVEELYDNYLIELINKGTVNKITTPGGNYSGSTEIIKINELTINPICDPVRDFVTIPYTSLTKKEVGLTYLCAKNGDSLTGETSNGFKYYKTNPTTGEIDLSTIYPMSVGKIYTVTLTIVDGAFKPVYVSVKDESGVDLSVGQIVKSTGATSDTVQAVEVNTYGRFYCMKTGVQAIESVAGINDYREQFRCASTPWFVSELKGDGKNLQVKKLFRLHTISDGNVSNTEVKVSVCNIRPDDGRFDLLIRDFNDSDGNIKILESYKNLCMVPGDAKYIGLQLGTLDGSFEARSKYVLAEVIETEMTKNCVPSGFLGYPVHNYKVKDKIVQNPSLTYNINYDSDIRVKKQYFGLSDITGVDVDMLTYKGREAYSQDISEGLTDSFHMDSTLSKKIRQTLTGITITVDGDPTTKDITWNTVNPDNGEQGMLRPVIGSEESMLNTIYEDKNMRKFTVCFYGGFDGWDIYRNARTNTDEFRANKYKGQISFGYGSTFSKITDGTWLSLDSNAISSDYYAYLAGVNQFEIPEKYVINLLATPGIDYVNNQLLVEDVLNIVEERRKDTLYVVDTPDKPWGASDAIDEMYSASDASANLDAAGIDTYYACTYYPWVKFYDKANKIYINLPATKDVLRNMADVDNKKYPWFAPAGIERGTVECERLHFFPKLEDEDVTYDGRINPLKVFSKDGIKVWGNKTMYTNDTPMNRINCVRLMLYMKKLIIESTRVLIFEPNDTTLKDQFQNIVKPILQQIKTDRGITDFRLDVSQTPEQMDAHEMSATIWVKPTPTLEYLEINFVVTPQGVDFSD